MRKSQSWYGSWPRPPKASASTSVAKETIFGGSVRSGQAPDLSRYDTKRDSDSASIQSAARSGSGLSKIPESNKVVANEDRDGDTKPDEEMKDDEQTDAPSTNEDGSKSSQPETNPPAPNTPQRPATAEGTSAGWLGWLSRTPFTDTQTASTQRPPLQSNNKPDEAEIAAPPPSTPVAQTTQSEGPKSDTPNEPPRSTSWFGFWSSAAPVDSQGTKEDVQSKEGQTDDSGDVVMSDAPPAKIPESAPQAGSTWAFWSKDSPGSKGTTQNQESGQIAVMGEGSEAQPKPMTEIDVTPSKKQKESSGKSTWRKSNKRLRPPSMDIDAQSPSPSASGTSTPQEPVQGQTPAKVDPPSKSIADSETSSKSQGNVLLPTFSSTYQMKQDPSIVKQIAQLILRTQQKTVNHVHRARDVPRIRKAISIGIHGLFPATYLRAIMGQPTGTSIRFATLGAEAIRRWVDAHDSSDCEIEKVALEGEGKINERVDNLWKLMLNWIEHIRSADLILISCHSQGVPVSIMLLEKLIDLGIITTARIGVCAMAGVSLGPFPDHKSSILMGSAAELWDFGNLESCNALRYESSLKRVVDYGARITFIGSIDDQVVPMESAVYSPANHPYIYRAAFIDGRVHAPDFIAHLVGFALKLRNLGISDHGLIRELSTPLAGSLYSGEGHSRLYYDSQVYDLAVSHALETTSIPKKQECEIHHRNKGTLLGAQGQTTNPYVLPWIMRGLLEEDFVKTELSAETEELLRQFDDWKPTNKALKDVKYRLEAVRSKL